VVLAAGRQVGMIINNEDDIRDLQTARVEEVLNKAEHPFIDGILPEKGRMIQVLNPDYILTSTEAQKLAKVTK